MRFWLTTLTVLFLWVLGGLWPSTLISVARAADERCFPETQLCLSGQFREYWEQQGGLTVFGFPITTAREEPNRDKGGLYLTQWLERNRFEYHPEQKAPYEVLLGRLGDEELIARGIDWRTLPREREQQQGCLWFAQTGHNVCDQAPGVGFKMYWQTHGLQDARLSQYARSLALFGLPLTEARMETNSSGDRVLTQWFERARFEYHPTKAAPYKVLLGRLGPEVRDWRSVEWQGLRIGIPPKHIWQIVTENRPVPYTHGRPIIAQAAIVIDRAQYPPELVELPSGLYMTIVRFSGSLQEWLALDQQVSDIAVDGQTVRPTTVAGQPALVYNPGVTGTGMTQSYIIRHQADQLLLIRTDVAYVEYVDVIGTMTSTTP